MKALNLHGVNSLVYEEVPTPAPQDGEVLLKIRASGVCGSDIQRVFEKGTYKFPTIPGHEFAGEVVAVHDHVVARHDHRDKDLIGRRAAVFPMLPCRECPACEVGEYAQCKNYNYYGSRCDGGFAEYLAVKKWNLAYIPDEVTFEEAAMCEPMAVAIHALSQIGVELGDCVAIYGAGTIGILLAKIATIWGASKVILVDIDQKKLEAANRLGFRYTINSLESDAPTEIMNLTGGRGADAAVEGAGVSMTLENCFKSAKTFGRIALMGNPAKDMAITQKGYWEILRKQLTLRGTWNSSYSSSRNDWAKAIELIPKIRPAELITHRFPLEAGIKAIETLKNKESLSLKVMYIL